MVGNTFREGRFIFDFTHSMDAFIADKPQYNGLSAVDFIVETEECFLFIEVKDPLNPKGAKHGNSGISEKFKEQLQPRSIATKFKDNLLLELAKGKTFQKPIVYIFILELDAAQRRKIFEEIHNDKNKGKDKKAKEKIKDVDAVKEGYDNANNQIPKFEGDEFSAVKEAIFEKILNIKDFQKKFPQFKVISINR